MGKKRTRKASQSPVVQDTSELIGTTEGASILGVNPSTFRRWVKEGRIESFKVGKQWRVRRSDLSTVVRAPEPQSEPASQDVGKSLERAGKAIDKLLAKTGIPKGEADRLIRDVGSQSEKAGKADRPARSLLARLMIYAVRATVSDLHFEPFEHCLKIRHRIDGVLMEAAELPKAAARPLIDEAMRWAALNLEYRRRIQDGRFLIDLQGRPIDVRVNSVPAVHGNVLALRILDRSVARPPMDKLGFEPEQLERYRQIVHRPNGLILYTGPTGCGKTTTIYATLGELNTPERKIMTAEDPVEFALEGINQVPINPTIGIGFAQVVRAMLRQAPNIMFVGEIRDSETANLCVSAALTGHLVLSTLHTNDAPSGVTRLLDMGLPPFALASALQALVAQRLVRLTCAKCRTPVKPSDRELDSLGLAGAERSRDFRQGKGCPHCHLTGYRGRTAIYQLLEFNGAMRSAVAQGASTEELRETARRTAGLQTMREVALQKVFRGETTIEEVVRATCSPDGPGVV